MKGLGIRWDPLICLHLSGTLILTISNIATGHEKGEFSVRLSPILDVTTTVNCILEERSSDKRHTCQNLLRHLINSSDVFYYEEVQSFSFDKSLIDKVKFIVNSLNLIYANVRGVEEGKPEIFFSFRITNPAKDYNVETQAHTSSDIGVFSSLSGIVLDWKTNSSLCSTGPLATGKYIQDIKSLGGTFAAFGYPFESATCSGAPSDLKHADFLALHLSFKIEDFIPSYEIFKQHMLTVTEKHEQYIKGLGPKRTVYILKFEDVIKGERHYILFTKFVLEWGRERGKQVILDTSSLDSTRLHDVLTNRINSMVSVNRRVTPTWTWVSLKARHSCTICHWPYKEMVRKVGSTFSSLWLSFDVLECISHCWSKDDHLNNSSSRDDDLLEFGSVHRAFISFPKGTRPASIPSSIAHLQNHAYEFRQLHKIVVLPTEIFEPWLGDHHLMNLLRNPAQRTSFGCEVDFGDHITEQEDMEMYLEAHRCDPIFESVKVFILKISLSYDNLILPNNMWTTCKSYITHKLENAYNAGRNFVGKYPGKTFALYITSERKIPAASEPRSSTILHCDGSKHQLNLYSEAIANWAYLRGVDVVLREAFDLVLETAWFNILPLPPGLNRKNQFNFVAQMRNFPVTLQSSESSPCLDSPTGQGPKEKIPFDFAYFGTSVDFNLKNGSLTNTELIRLLQFSLHKFHQVEILLRQDPFELKTHIHLVLDAIKFILDCDSELAHSVRLFVDFPLPPDSDEMGQGLQGAFQAIIEGLSGMRGRERLQVGGVHLSRWEDHENKAQLLDLVGRAKGILPVGLTVQNCSTELDKTIYSTNSPGESSLLSKVDYVVCSEPPRNGDNQSLKEISDFMDGHLVVQHTAKKLFPTMGVHFRVSTTLRHNATRKFLDYTTQIAQLSTSFNVSYFLPAFDSPQSGVNGWWRIQNYSGLDDVFNYVERESDFLDSPTRRPRATPSANEGSTMSISPFVAGALFTIAFAMVLLAVAIWYRVKKRSKFLTDAEVNEFLLGRSSQASLNYADLETTEEDGGGGGEEFYTSLKFNEEYQLAKKDCDVDFRNMLGTGNFGSVYKGKVKGVEVAVKVQHLGCSKNTFKSMLNEVKILSWVGTHRNVLGFVGCYTKEISKGVIYIATELCSNGSLQSYLRTKYSNPDRLYENLESAMVQDLVRFATEIASGMEYIASRRVVHGDLSARNVLLDEDYTCKIGDFGLSRKLYEYNKYVKQNQEPLPWRWMALESLKFMEFTSKSDVWSYGITVWEIFSLGEVPYGGRAWSVNFRDEIESGMRLTKPHLAKEEIHTKILLCWKVNPDERPTFAEMYTFFEDLWMSALESEDASMVFDN